MKKALLYSSLSALNVAAYFYGEPSFLNAFIAGLCAATAIDTRLKGKP
jgi:hypothetical protein